MLFSNRDGSSHAFVFCSAEIVAMKGERSGFVWYEAQRGGFSCGDVASDFKSWAGETVQSVQGCELQDRRNPFFHCDGIGGELELFGGNLDNLLGLLGMRRRGRHAHSGGNEQQSDNPGCGLSDAHTFTSL